MKEKKGTKLRNKLSKNNNPFGGLITFQNIEQKIKEFEKSFVLFVTSFIDIYFSHGHCKKKTCYRKIL